MVVEKKEMAEFKSKTENLDGTINYDSLNRIKRRSCYQCDNTGFTEDDGVEEICDMCNGEKFTF